MLNKIFLTIILLCGIASASALDDVNRNLCNIKHDFLSITITCTPRANEYNVKKIELFMYKDLSSCNEVYVNHDGTSSTRYFAVNVGTYTDYDEFGVTTHKFSDKVYTKEACLFLYNAYKEAAKRW